MPLTEALRFFENDFSSMIPHCLEALRIESKYIQAKMLCLNLPLQLSALIHGPLWGLLACCSHYVGTAVLTVWPAGIGVSVSVFEMDKNVR